jgi:hypothetical protein
MQAAHERAEASAQFAAHITDRLKLKETEAIIMHGHVSPMQKKLQERITLLQESWPVSDAEYVQEYMGVFLPAGAVPLPPTQEALAADSLHTLTKMIGDGAIAKMDLAQCKKTEEQMLGIQPKVPLSAMPRYAPDLNDRALPALGAPQPPPNTMSEKVQAKAHAFKLVTGRSPSAEEIQKWMGSKY